MHDATMKKGSRVYSEALKFLVEHTGIEPVTSRLRTLRSPKLS